MEFETRKLTVKKFMMEYADVMYEAWGTDGDVVKYLPGYRYDWDLNDFTESVLKEYQDPNFTRLIIQEKKTNEIIGSINLYQEDSKSKSIIIILKKDAWGMGYGTDALRGLIKALKKEKLEILYATCDKRNLAATRMLEDCGFELIDTIPDARCDIDGVVGDELLYEMEYKK